MANTASEMNLAMCSTHELSSIKFVKANWWRRRSRMERNLCVSTVILFTISFAALIALFYLNSRYRFIEELNIFERVSQQHRSNTTGTAKDRREKSGDYSDVCLTPACIETAHMILSRIDDSVSPCDDFYKFACGRWLNTTVIPDNKVSVSTAGDVADMMEDQLRTLVEESLHDDDPIYFRNIGIMYNSCMNLSLLEHIGDEPLIDVIYQLGGWPLVDGKRWTGGAHFNWIETTEKLVSLGLMFNKFFQISVGLDFRNNTNHVISIGEIKPGIGGRKLMSKGFNDSTVAAYYQLILESAVLLGANREHAKHEVLELFEFHLDMIKLTTPQEEARNLSKFYNKMSVQQLQELAPNVPWLYLLSIIFNQTDLENDTVLVSNPSYVKQMDLLIQKTDKRILANHMVASIVISSVGFLDSKWRRISDEFIYEITGKTAEPPRWKTCLKAASSLFTAFSALYVRKHFNQKSKEKVHEMMTYIHNEFIQTLIQVDWMDNRTKAKALEKAYAITTRIGYPEELLNNSKIAEVYEDLEEYSGDKYFENALKMSKWAINYSNKQLHKPRVKGHWETYAGAAVVNAYYSSIENAIIFPAGILQGHFFKYDRPNYMNFGAIGSVIGHEITHGFDDIGRQFDKDGNNINWWDKKTDRKFREKAQCMINQYSRYTVAENGMRINGIITQGENIADNAGVKQAFNAYRTYSARHPKEPLLPGLNYTAEQLFWLSYANVWCTKIRPEIFKLMLTQGSHSPGQFRVIGTLTNLKEFSQSFNCPKNSAMNAKIKCTVW